MDRRRDIDGLRALAVLIVIFFHAGQFEFRGGFVGVDVFFAISGFLIIPMVVTAQKERRFEFTGFLLRRLRRLLPAMVPMLIFAFGAATLLLGDARFDAFLASFVGASAYLSNHVFLAQSGYFDAAAHEKFLLHTWSLAAEFQFYLVTPFLLRLAKGDRTRATLGLLVLSALSFGFSEYLRNGNASAAFYLMAPRFWEFALGGIAALWFPWRQGALWQAVLLRGAGVVVILWATNSYRVDSAFPGVGALPPVLAAIAILAAPVAKRDPVLWLLQSKGANWLGLRSYSAYLWHWPLMVAALLFADRPSDELLLGMGLLGIVMGAVSYRLIERPTQSSALWIAPRRLLPLAMLAPSLVVAIGVLPPAWRSALPLADFRSVLTMVDHEFTAYRATVSESTEAEARGIQCSYDDVGKLPAEAAQTTLTECLTSHGQRPFTLVIGDSHGRDLFQSLRQAFPARTFVHLNQSACPPLAGHVKKFGITTCFAGLEAHLQTAIGAGAESIVLGSHWPDLPNAEFEKTAALLKATGLPVIVSGAGPISRFEIPRLIAKGAADPLGETRLALPEPLVNSGRDAVAMEAALKAWAETQGWAFSSKYAAFCANSYCDVAERQPDGELGLLFWDNQHFTLRGIARFAEWLRDDPAFAALK